MIIASIIAIVGAAAFVSGYYVGTRRESAKFHCDHRWKTTGISYAQARGGGSASGFVDRSVLAYLTVGITTITEECSRCGRVDTREVTGKVSKPGHQLRDTS